MRRACLFVSITMLAQLGAMCSTAQPAAPIAAREVRPAAPVEQSVRPGINDDYKTGDIPKYAGRFESESREVFRERAQIVAALGVKRGQTVADVGAGTGLFTLLLAEAVGSGGKVIAQEIFPEFLRHIGDRARGAGHDNVECRLGQERSADLPAATCDLIFICDVYHHFEYPQSMLASLHDALKRGGRLAVLDFERIEGVSPQWILDHVRAGREQVIAEIESAGFRRTAPQPQADFLTQNYLVIFEKSR